MKIKELDSVEMMSINGGKNWRKIFEGAAEFGGGVMSVNDAGTGREHDSGMSSMDRGWKKMKEGWNEGSKKDRGPKSRGSRRRK